MGVVGHDLASFKDASELPPLVSYLRQGRCVLFVGAGLSRPAGYPDWPELMRHVVAGTREELGEAALHDELEALLARGRYPEVADQCRTLLGRVRFARLLRGRLAREAAPPEATHRAIVRTPYACIVTTNFDTLLEDAYARWSEVGIPKAPTGMELAQHGTLLLDGAFFILKAHGSIDDEASMVFTSEDYRRITHANPAFQAVMGALLLTHSVLFVGYSISDPNFRLLIDSQLSTFGGESPPRYALMEDVGAAERAILRRTAGIEVISFPKGAYGEVAGLLQYLATAARDPQAAPAPARPVLRPEPGSDALVLRLQARDVMVDSTWYRTRMDDLDGSALPLEAMRTVTAPTPDWSALQPLVPAAVDEPAGPAAVASAGQAGEVLAQAVPGVEGELLDLPGGTAVVLDVDPSLAALPWEWMTVGGTPLAAGRPVIRRMSGLRDASRGRPLVHTPPRVLLVGDTLAEHATPYPLAGARAEIEGIGQRLSGTAGAEVTTLQRGEATYARVLAALRDGAHDVVHFACMSYQDAAGPFLLLHDGKVRPAELVTLLIKRPPALLFLNAMYTGFVPVFCQVFPLELRHGTSFDDHYRALRRHRVGFDRAAARAGVGTFVGTMGTTMDDSARDMALGFYEALLRGRTAVQALHEARRAVLESQAAGRLALDSAPLQFSISGYADMRLLPRPAAAPTSREPVSRAMKVRDRTAPSRR